MLGYADDILLIARSVSGSNLVLNAVSRYGKDFSIKFNPSKTKWVIYGDKDILHNVIFEGAEMCYSFRQ